MANPSTDALSPEDIAALMHAQQQLYTSGDPRATKLYNYILQNGYAQRGPQGELRPMPTMSAAPSWSDNLKSMFTHPLNSLEAESQQVSTPRDASLGEMLGTDLSNAVSGGLGLIRHPLQAAGNYLANGLGARPIVEDAENAIIRAAGGTPQRPDTPLLPQNPDQAAYAIGQGLATGGMMKALPAVGAVAAPAADALAEAADMPSATPAEPGLIRNWALGDPDEAVMRGLHISPQSPKAQIMLQAAQGARPYLQGVQGLEDLQNRIPAAKQEIWQPYADALQKVGGNAVKGPDGEMTTVQALEDRRLELSAQLRTLKKGGPEAVALAQQKGLTQASLLQQEAQIKAALDPQLRHVGIDPAAIRKSFSQVSAVGNRVRGKTTIGEGEQPYTFGRIQNLSAVKPLAIVPEAGRAIRDLAAGRPLWAGNPTDVAIKEAFRPSAAGPQPPFTVPTQGIAGLLPRGAIEMPAPVEAQQISSAPPYTQVPQYYSTRAQRLGLLLPQDAGGKITLPYYPEMTADEKVAAFMQWLRQRAQPALPAKASPFITPPPQQ